MREESAEEVKHPEPTEKSTQDQLSTMFVDSDEECNLAQCMLADSGITVEDAIKSTDVDSWKAAIEKEDRGLEKKGVLSTQECPAKAKPLKTKYILTKKKAPDGSIIKFKARRVVQGFHQKYGRDFIETFCPVVGFDALRVIYKMMIEHKWQYNTMALLKRT